MTISNLKELSRLIDLCRKKGIDSVEIDGIKIKLGAKPQRSHKEQEALASVPQYSEEDLINWSVQGVG